MLLPGTDAAIESLLSRMTLTEKVGQMTQFAWRRTEPHAADEWVETGRLGSMLNAPTREQRNRVQRLAMESRLGIPLIFGRDVIHGLRTIFPIPLGQAASFDPALAERCAAAAAREAAEVGIDWTFAPMVDVSRDPRWGRVAEGSGEDALLASKMGAAMVRGYQGEDPSGPGRIAACAKHFAGYGASESGKDYNTTWIPEQLLREHHLPAFKACVEAGVLTLMSAFTDLNGVPATANALLLRQVLKGEWNFDGFVVSDWGSTRELVVHGLCEDERSAAQEAVGTGLDMEMAATTFMDNVPKLVEQGALDPALVDEAVRRILSVKQRLGLFDRPYAEEPKTSVLVCDEHLELARRSARESLVLLKNDGILPLSEPVQSLAVIGSLADDAKNQLGCWAYGGDVDACQTALSALRGRLSPNTEVRYAEGLPDPRSLDTSGFDAAVRAVSESDVGLVFLGEHWNISGECRSRAFLDLPGAQAELVEALAATKKPLVFVIQAGRPLTLGRILEKAGAALFAFHPGTMTGPALVDVLTGDHAPSGKLPMTFPRAVGQIPIYYAMKNGGRPASQEFKGIPEGTPLDPVGFDASYLDVDVSPLFPFGFGLSYTSFEYSNLRVTKAAVPLGAAVEIRCDVTNTGTVSGTDVAQLYVRDRVGSLTRPIRELKDFARVNLTPGESKTLDFTLDATALSFYGREMKPVLEAGRFDVFVGGDSTASLRADFELVG